MGGQTAPASADRTSSHTLNWRFKCLRYCLSQLFQTTWATVFIGSILLKIKFYNALTKHLTIYYMPERSRRSAIIILLKSGGGARMMNPAILWFVPFLVPRPAKNLLRFCLRRYDKNHGVCLYYASISLQ